MSNKAHHHLLARSEQTRVVSFSWLCNNASNPDPASFVGEGVLSVTKTANAGEFEVTLDDTYARVVNIIGAKSSDGAEPAAAYDFHFPDAPATIPTTGKFLVEYRQNGAGVNRTAANNVRIGFTLIALNRVRGV
jgi:hypothetical protein